MPFEAVMVTVVVALQQHPSFRPWEPHGAPKSEVAEVDAVAEMMKMTASIAANISRTDACDSFIVKFVAEECVGVFTSLAVVFDAMTMTMRRSCASRELSNFSTEPTPTGERSLEMTEGRSANIRP